MQLKSEHSDPFKELRWSDLQDWAGGKATAKGIKYQEDERVKELKRTQEGSLVARVEGTKEYFTEIFMENGKLSSICTCPVGHDCKHGVAAVLEYLELTEQREEIPVISEGDTLIARARQGYTEAETAGAGKGEESSTRALREYLEQLTKPELIEILVAFAEKDTVLGRYLKDRQNLAAESVEGIIEGVYSELDELLEEAGHPDYPGYESDVPDFLDVQVRLESLLDAGHPDELLDIGKELMDRYEGIAEYDEEGNIGTKISFCMDVVFEALSRSSLPAHEKMLYMFEIELRDNYNILDETTFWEEGFTPEEWKRFAETLKVKLQEADRAEDTHYSSSWQRDYAVDRLIDALLKAGLSEEIIPICEREAEKTGNYARLVNVLLDSGQKKKAEEWIYRGIKETREYQPGIARELWQILLETREEEGNWLFAAALEAEEFFRAPDMARYLGMREAARNSGKWQEVREAALRYLKTGELPAVQAKAAQVKNKEEISGKEEISILPGVLPKTGLLETDSIQKIKAPALDLLIKVAIQEEDPEEVVHWYEELKTGGEEAERYWHLISESEIANAVKEKHPEIALEIWKKLVEGLISETKVSSYEEASTYLRKIKETLETRGKKENWEAYLSGIKEANRRKRRLLEILDMLGEDRIISE
ncbi:SWIM zinc finger domain-containing protein [Methanosarcina sp.]|uniref:SWIM zinc finger family protein n=1 Tax=Methanosarcina sp. TaxID=2213 RepID=UPI002ABC712C|nr:SWIM zinc finger domain-containing protein [Methanosarcina sp.]MDY9925704.1 SWIM zinc finger domain-containing protein [Methanosarcina sp.]